MGTSFRDEFYAVIYSFVYISFVTEARICLPTIGQCSSARKTVMLVLLMELFVACSAEHSYLSNTLKKKARSLRSKIVRGPSYTQADKPAALIVRTGSFSDTSTSDSLTKKTVSSLSVFIMVASARI